jgi:hypothetical protein
MLLRVTDNVLESRYNTYCMNPSLLEIGLCNSVVKTLGFYASCNRSKDI